MIHRTSTLVKLVHDYQLDPPAAPAIPGATMAAGAAVFFAPTTYQLTETVTGFSLAVGGFSFNGASYPAGDYLLKRVGNDVQLYRTAPSGAGELQDETDETDELTFNAGTAMRLFVLSDATLVVTTNVPEGATFDGVAAVAGQVEFDLNVPRSQIPRLLEQAPGVELDEWVGWLYPGDTLRYVPPDYVPQPVSDAYQASPNSDTLQARVEKLDLALRSGGLVRLGPMPEGLAYPPDSGSYLPMATLTYRLPDEETFTLRVDARTGGSRLALTVRGRQELMPLTDTAHFFGGNRGVGFAWGDPAQGLALEVRDGAAFCYRLDASSPTCARHDGAWQVTDMPYLLPVGDGYLVDRRHRVRLTAGPYLAGGEYLDGHADHLVLAGGEDVPEGEFTPMAVNGQMRTYAAVGRAAFDPRFALLLRGE